MGNIFVTIFSNFVYQIRMKDLSERDRLVQSLKNISDKVGIEALNYLIQQPQYTSDSRRNYCLQFIIQEKITSVTIVDRAKLEQIENSKGMGDKEQNAIPHAPNHEGFFNQLFMAMESSKQVNFFFYEKSQLVLVAEEKSRKPMERILREIGLKVIYFRL
jgi:hypothetical protein